MKHIKTFENYIYESVDNETLNEASTAMRAWSGKIGNIDKLLSWMYDKKILNKGEQSEKDTIFRQYYRYYNDGDFPKGLASKGIRKYDPKEKIGMALEQYIEGFIKKILAKYTGKYDRKDFRLDTLLGDLNTLESITSSYDVYGLLNYWSNKIKTGNTEFEDLLVKLRPAYDKAKSAVNKQVEIVYASEEKSYNNPGDNTTITHQKRCLEDKNGWTPELDKVYKEMTDIMDNMAAILKTVIEATQKLKAEVGTGA